MKIAPILSIIVFAAAIFFMIVDEGLVRPYLDICLTLMLLGVGICVALMEL